MKAILLILSLFGQQNDFTNQIATETALVKVQQAPKPALVKRSECKKCKGTGKIAAGDGVTKVTRDCDACYDDKASQKLGDAITGAIKALPDLKEVQETMILKSKTEGGLSRRWVFGHADWCGYCKQMMSNKNGNSPFQVCQYYGITVGDENCQIQLVDVEKEVDVAAYFNIGESLPVLVLIENGKEIDRKSGYQRSTVIRAGLNTAAAPAQKAAVPQQNRNGRVNADYLRRWVKTYKGEEAYVTNQTDFGHLIHPASNEHHGGVFEAWQLNGLSIPELRKIHGGMHAGVLTPYGAKR